jgi:hypothetical protein
MPYATTHPRAAERLERYRASRPPEAPRGTPPTDPRATGGRHGPRVDAPIPEEERRLARKLRGDGLRAAMPVTLVAGAAAGGAVGTFAGPIGLVIGAIVGALVGAGAGMTMEDRERARLARDSMLDRTIGVTEGAIGTRAVRHPPARHGLYSGASAGASAQSTRPVPDAGPMPQGGA